MNGTSGEGAADVIVVAGGAAGLTAALVLARARHRITVVDDQTHRNATVDEFHGFPTRDATTPNRFRADALAELHSYGVLVVRTAAAPTTSRPCSVRGRRTSRSSPPPKSSRSSPETCVARRPCRTK